ncbi:MAG: Asp-tRNA(Asn)/Glu-tRNA(Gln) amidotransferase subunit GatC [Syntrophorhabdaceae bacterium]|nr:Asp-tRNA(Asn)/Glu-tRNA(Gln) amidotransferase subunit GatC [Syntrophorhabdaceae bacterium]
MKITREEIEYIGHLSRLELSPEEVEMYTLQVGRILEYMEKLKTLNTEGVVSTSHAMPIKATIRDDGVSPSFTIEESLSNAPDRFGAFFRVPPIIEVDE